MQKREFLRLSGLFTIGWMAQSVWANHLFTIAKSDYILHQTAFTVPELPYKTDALEPHIDAKTMEIHHGKHHAGYVKNLNDALEKAKFPEISLIELLQTLMPDQTAIRNNAGGHYNHALFWSILMPNAAALPTGKFAQALNQSFGSFEDFKAAFQLKALKHFGSGWAWLCVAPDNSLFISTTPNQDNPLMLKVVARSGVPIMGIDVWEHAYYLKHQNKRADYLEAIFKIWNWAEIEKRYIAALH